MATLPLEEMDFCISAAERCTIFSSIGRVFTTSTWIAAESCGMVTCCFQGFASELGSMG